MAEDLGDPVAGVARSWAVADQGDPFEEAGHNLVAVHLVAVVEGVEHHVVLVGQEVPEDRAGLEVHVNAVRVLVGEGHRRSGRQHFPQKT